MKPHFSALLLVAVAALAQGQTPAPDLKSLIGRSAVVQRMPFYEIGTYRIIPNTYAGQTVTIIAAKPSALFGTANVKAFTFVVQFPDGTKADTGPLPVVESALSSWLELLPQTSLAVPTSAVTASAVTAPPIIVPSAVPTQTVAIPKQDCPLKLTKIKYAGLGTGLAAAMLGMTSKYLPNSAYELHVTSQSDKETRVIETTTRFFNLMGDVVYPESSSLVQVDLKAGKSKVTLGTTPLGIVTSNAPSMRAWLTRVKFKDGSFWTDDGSQSCAVESNTK
jgi:hypothetical protein